MNWRYALFWDLLHIEGSCLGDYSLGSTREEKTRWNGQNSTLLNQQHHFDSFSSEATFPQFDWMQSGWLISTSSFNFDLKASSGISQRPKSINHSVTVHFLNSLHSYHLEKRVCPKQVLQRISFTKFSFLTPKLLWGLFIHMYSSRFVRYNNFKLIFEATIGMFKMNSKIDSIFWKSSLPKSPKKPYQTIFLLQRIDLWWAIEKTSFWV